MKAILERYLDDLVGANLLVADEYIPATLVFVDDQIATFKILGAANRHVHWALPSVCSCRQWHHELKLALGDMKHPRITRVEVKALFTLMHPASVRIEQVEGRKSGIGVGMGVAFPIGD